MPSWTQWCEYKHQQHDTTKYPDSKFPGQYALAKTNCFKNWETRIVKIAHDESRDLLPDGKGGFKSDNTAVNRDRLKIDSYKWLMSKLMPKVYGEMVKQEISGPNEGPIQILPALNITSHGPKKSES